MSPRLLLASALTCLAGFGCTLDREYDGRSAAEWAADLRDPSRDVRRTAAFALIHIQPRSRPVVRALLAASADSDDMVQAGAITALDAAGDRAVPALSVALHDDHAFVRSQAANVLASIGMRDSRELPSIIGALDTAVDDRDARVAAQAMLGLARFGPLAALLAPHLPSRLSIRAHDADPTLQIAALDALASVASATTALPTLQRALHDPEPDVREAAAFALGRLHGDSRPAISALTAARADRDSSVRVAAAVALDAIEHPQTAPPPEPTAWERCHPAAGDVPDGC